jgi:hypothetical protein
MCFRYGSCVDTISDYFAHSHKASALYLSQLSVFCIFNFNQRSSGFGQKASFVSYVYTMERHSIYPPVQNAINAPTCVHVVKAEQDQTRGTPSNVQIPSFAITHQALISSAEPFNICTPAPLFDYTLTAIAPVSKESMPNRHTLLRQQDTPLVRLLS